MTPERWQQIDAIVAEALQYRNGSERGAFIDRACAGDQSIRNEVESLLSHEADAEPFVAGVVQEAAQQFARSNKLGLEAGERLGAYRILREIGRGGMGTVYLAERADDQFRKQVAIKLVTRGMDTADLLRRFRHERQILARLDHPYIARLLDGGSSEDGRPYLVMEYVEGIPITKYCAEHNLSTRARVELFRKVCAAIQSAHQQLVVHRDLKPSNILVDAEGAPKLLDFGIAKLLDRDEAAQFTVPGAMQMLTPDYASPEQVLGERITTAADIYSLGAILYELLAGTSPHRFRTYAPTEIERVVCHDDPPPLQLGDLGNIVSMAMQ
jgi:serine/threonine protein kinase